MEESCTCIDWRDMSPSPFCKKCGGKGYVSDETTSVNASDQIYVVQSRSGIILKATINYHEARAMKVSLDESEYDKGRLSVWVNGKCVNHNFEGDS